MPDGGGLDRNPGTAMPIKASLRSFALIMCLGLWKWNRLESEDHVYYPKLTVSVMKNL